MVSVSDHFALPRLAAICSRIHASTSDSIQPMARAPSRTGLGKLPLGVFGPCLVESALPLVELGPALALGGTSWDNFSFSVVDTA